MADVALLGIQARLEGVEKTVDGLERISKGATKAENASNALTGALGTVAGAFGIALTASAVQTAADSWSDLNARLALTVGGAEKAAAVMERLQDVAKNTYSDLGLTVESFMANAGVLSQLGKSTKESLDYTEALNNALVISGARGDRAARVQDALSKAMAAGKLSGDQLNTIIESGGKVAELLAKELGISTLQLRKFGAEGKITGDVMFNALTKPIVELREQAGDMPATMSDAATGVKNAFLTIVGTIDAATGSSGALAQSIYDMSYQVSAYAGVMAQVAVTVQTVFANAWDSVTTFIGNLTGGLSKLASGFNTNGALMAAGIGLATTAALGLASALIGPVVGAITAVGAAVLLNPLGLLVGAFATVTAAAFIFRDELRDIFGVDLVSSAKGVVNSIIGFFVGAYNVVVAQWENLPLAFSSIGKKAWNALVEQFEGESLWVEVAGQRFTLFDGINLDGFKATIDEAEKTVVDSSKRIMDDALAVDYVANMKDNVVGVWKEAGAAAEAFKALGNSLDSDGGKPAAGLNEISKAAKKAKDSYASIVLAAKERLAQMELEEQLVGRTGVAADVMRMKLDMLYDAQKKGLTLSAAQKAELEGLADAYGVVAERVAALQLMEEARFERAQLFRSPIDASIASDLRNAGIEMDSVAGQAYASFKRTTDQISQAKDMTKQFASGFISDVLNGKSAVEALGNALQNLANKLIDMALDSAINSLFGNLGGLFGGGGMGMNFFPAAPSSGPIGLFADGGVSTKPAIFGEAGPEAAVPLPDGRTIPVTLNSGAGVGGGAENVNSGNVYNFSGTSEEFQQFKKFVMERDKQFNARAVNAVQKGAKQNKGF